jgi:pyruvate kinase
MIDAGLDVVRLNLSHGARRAPRRLATGARASPARGRHVAVLADLPGPKIRAGQFPEGGVTLPPQGASIEL